MRLTKTDPQLGEIAVETSHPGEISQLKAAGYREPDQDAPATAGALDEATLAAAQAQLAAQPEPAPKKARTPRAETTPSPDATPAP